MHYFFKLYTTYINQNHTKEIWKVVLLTVTKSSDLFCHVVWLINNRYHIRVVCFCLRFISRRTLIQLTLYNSNFEEKNFELWKGNYKSFTFTVTLNLFELWRYLNYGDSNYRGSNCTYIS